MSNRKKRILFVSILAVVSIAHLFGGVVYLHYFLSLVCTAPVDTDIAGLLIFGAAVWGGVLFDFLDLWYSIFSSKRKKKSPALEVTKDA